MTGRIFVLMTAAFSTADVPGQRVKWCRSTFGFSDEMLLWCANLKSVLGCYVLMRVESLNMFFTRIEYVFKSTPMLKTGSREFFQAHIMCDGVFQTFQRPFVR